MKGTNDESVKSIVPITYTEYDVCVYGGTPGGITAAPVGVTRGPISRRKSRTGTSHCVIALSKAM
ncbi:FAD-dependent oxidoreductase [bacterium]|nr:FAD-dependent oxidoreductase [bacterium]